MASVPLVSLPQLSPQNIAHPPAFLESLPPLLHLRLSCAIIILSLLSMHSQRLLKGILQHSSQTISAQRNSAQVTTSVDLVRPERFHEHLSVLVRRIPLIPQYYQAIRATPASSCTQPHLHYLSCF